MLERLPRGGSHSNYVSEQMSVASNKDMATLVADKQRRLLQLGYSKEILKNNPALVKEGTGRNKTISHNEDYTTSRKDERLQAMNAPRQSSDLHQLKKLPNDRVSSSRRSYFNLMHNTKDKD